MKAKEARKLTNFTIKEQKRDQSLLNSLKPVFSLIEDKIEEGSYKLFLNLDELSLDQQACLVGLGYKLYKGNPASCWDHSYISWRE